VNFAILPSRPKQSAEAYQKVWTPAGSPLVAISRNVQAKLQSRVKLPVELAMRYQNPSIPEAVQRLEDKGVDHLLLIPLFPHYAMSSFESAVERVREAAGTVAPRMRIEVQPPFYDHPDYIAALAASAGNTLIVNTIICYSAFTACRSGSFASPIRPAHCLASGNCCEIASPATPPVIAPNASKPWLRS